jgi:hypothetical protein
MSRTSLLRVFIVLILVAGVAYIFVPTDIDSGWPQQQFTSEAWKSRPPNARYQLTKDLIRSQRLMGKSSRQVEEILGSPNYQSPDGRYWLYPIQDRESGVGGFNAATLLNIDFDEGKKVTGTSLRQK